MTLLEPLRPGDKILITGGSGMLGSNLSFLWANDFEVASVDTNPMPLPNVRSFCLDLRDGLKTKKTVREIFPQVIIHTAALTNVDYCEANPREAYLLNVEATRNLLEACRDIGRQFVYISTDFVFDGVKGRYNEDDKTNPLNVYGKTKLEGERAVIESGLNFLVVRTSIYGWNVLPKESFVETIINRLRQGQALTPFADQEFTPIYTETLGEIILDLLKRQKNGLYHIASSEIVSKYKFATLVAEEFGLQTKLLQPTLSSKVDFKSKRPNNVSLVVFKILNELGIESIKIKTDLKKMHSKENIYDSYKKDRKKN